MLWLLERERLSRWRCHSSWLSSRKPAVQSAALLEAPGLRPKPSSMLDFFSPNQRHCHAVGLRLRLGAPVRLTRRSALQTTQQPPSPQWHAPEAPALDIVPSYPPSSHQLQPPQRIGVIPPGVQHDSTNRPVQLMTYTGLPVFKAVNRTTAAASRPQRCMAPGSAPPTT